MGQSKPIVVVQGGQYGSEAKGAVAAALCLNRNIDFAVRTGAINAGHTVVYQGKKYAMQQLPTGWINPHTKLVIGPGAYIHPETLWNEVAIVNQAMPEADVRDRLYIDHRCGLHAPAAEKASKDANRHHRIGATGKGCSEAIVAKIRDRNNGYELFANSHYGKDWRMRAGSNGGRFTDTVKVLNGAIDGGASVLIEGTQGTLLDLHLGPYPFTTSRMTTAANWVAEAGLSPALDYEVVLVCRTYPIRVAGNSGPMDREIEWTDLARLINRKLDADGKPMLINPEAITDFEAELYVAAVLAGQESRYPTPCHNGNPDTLNVRLSTWTEYERDKFRVAASELHRDALLRLPAETVAELRKLFEMTTVTKKLRRIAELSLNDLRFAVQVNRPSWICMTFMDYVEPLLANKVGTESMPMGPWVRALEYCKAIESAVRVPVRGLSTGPSPEHCMLGVDTSLLPTVHSER